MLADSICGASLRSGLRKWTRTMCCDRLKFLIVGNIMGIINRVSSMTNRANNK